MAVGAEDREIACGMLTLGSEGARAVSALPAAVIVGPVRWLRSIRTTERSRNRQAPRKRCFLFNFMKRGEVYRLKISLILPKGPDSNKFNPPAWQAPASRDITALEPGAASSFAVGKVHIIPTLCSYCFRCFALIFAHENASSFITAREFPTEIHFRRRVARADPARSQFIGRGAGIQSRHPAHSF